MRHPHVKTGRNDYQRVPLTFRLYKNGTLINSEYTHLANCFLENQFANRRNTFYRLNLLPERNESEIVMAPGEHLVFTASNHVKTFNNEFSNLARNSRPTAPSPPLRRCPSRNCGTRHSTPEACFPSRRKWSPTPSLHRSSTRPLT